MKKWQNYPQFIFGYRFASVSVDITLSFGFQTNFVGIYEKGWTFQQDDGATDTSVVDFEEGSLSQSSHNKEDKIFHVLIYNKEKAWVSLDFTGCEESKCKLFHAHTNQSLNGMDAIIFHFPNHLDNLQVLEKPRSQVWIFFGREGPLRSPNYNKWQRLINWTSTVRRDSDINPGIYGTVNRRPMVLQRNLSALTTRKTKLIAWFVSNCNVESKRFDYVKILRKFVDVDIYGSCGRLRCSKKNVTKCYEMLNTTYKFYLSFENTLCRDYVTEKIFGIFSLTTIPIVRGSANYKMYFPPNSYIDTSHFRNVESLAKYIKYLDSNDTAYIELLSPRNVWSTFNQFNNTLFPLRTNRILCDVCKRLHDKDANVRLYESFQSWWNKFENNSNIDRRNNLGMHHGMKQDFGSMCHNATDLS